MIEIERKFRLLPDQKRSVAEALQAQYGPLHPIRQVDEVFLQGIHSFTEFTQGMPIMRLRSAEGTTTCTYKRRINEKGDMLEHEVVVDPADTMRAIIEEMGYHAVTRVDKIRLEARVGTMALALDAVEGLGDFFEIEIMAEDESHLDVAAQRIMATAATFGLTAADIEPRKYDQMIAAL